jgi:hypothetical protein
VASPEDQSSGEHRSRIDTSLGKGTEDYFTSTKEFFLPFPSHITCLFPLKRLVFNSCPRLDFIILDFWVSQSLLRCFPANTCSQQKGRNFVNRRLNCKICSGCFDRFWLLHNATTLKKTVARMVRCFRQNSFS